MKAENISTESLLKTLQSNSSKELKTYIDNNKQNLIDSVLKAYYAWHAPHFRLNSLAHNFTSSLRFSRCVWCKRSREEVRYDELEGRCLNRPLTPEISAVIKSEEESYLKLLKNQTDVVKKFFKSKPLNGKTLADLRQSHGTLPDDAMLILNQDFSLTIQNEFEQSMNEFRKLSRSKQVKEIVTVNL